jgi:hypothetical protein
MSGGIISKNLARNGCGIYINDSGSSFIKRATPPGSSSSGVIYGGVGDDANITLSGSYAGSGYAICRNFGTLRNRNNTLSGYDEISTGNDVGWE